MSISTLLRGATALVGMTICAPAGAQEWQVSVGGFMTTGVGYVDADAHKAEVEIVNDSEVHVSFGLTADNGLTFGARAEIENNGGADGNAYQYVGFVEGGFGRLEVGGAEGAGYRMTMAPAGCAYSCAADATGFLFDYASEEAGPPIDNYGLDSFNSLKITYFTPVVWGFQAGVSYSPNSDARGTSTVGSVGDGDTFEAGLSWSGDFGAFGLSASGVYFSLDDGETESFALSAGVGAYGVSLGARYANIDTVDDLGFGVDEENVGVGLGYETGPWFFGVQYAVVTSGDRRSTDDYALSGEVNYALAPGVTLAAVIEHADYEGYGASTAAGLFMDLGF